MEDDARNRRDPASVQRSRKLPSLAVRTSRLVPMETVMPPTGLPSTSTTRPDTVSAGGRTNRQSRVPAGTDPGSQRPNPLLP